MSVDHLKKQAKNAKHHLPDFIAQHSPPYALMECQEFVARINGYPSWHIAVKEAAHKAARPYDDPIAAFYSYDWRKSSLDGFMEVGNPTTCQIVEKRLSPAEAWSYLTEKSKSDPTGRNKVVLINQAGTAGGELLDKVYAENSGLAPHFSIITLTALSNRAGVMINPLDGLAADQITDLFGAILTPVASSEQLACCKDALNLLLSDVSPGAIDLCGIQYSVDRLVRLAKGGWTKNDEDFLETFPDENRHEEARDFLDLHRQRLPDLVRPLDALLTRLAAPGLDTTFNPRRCREMGECRDEAFAIVGGSEPEPLFDLFAELSVVDLGLGSDDLDHLAALFVTAKIRVASQWLSRSMAWGDETPKVELVLVKL